MMVLGTGVAELSESSLGNSKVQQNLRTTIVTYCVRQDCM